MRIPPARQRCRRRAMPRILSTGCARRGAEELEHLLPSFRCYGEAGKYDGCFRVKNVGSTAAIATYGQIERSTQTNSPRLMNTSAPRVAPVASR
jgi:hypothetical protein